jgi:hypothetical protein
VRGVRLRCHAVQERGQAQARDVAAALLLLLLPLPRGAAAWARQGEQPQAGQWWHVLDSAVLESARALRAHVQHHCGGLLRALALALHAAQLGLEGERRLEVDARACGRRLRRLRLLLRLLLRLRLRRLRLLRRLRACVRVCVRVQASGIGLVRSPHHQQTPLLSMHASRSMAAFVPRVGRVVFFQKEI